MRIATYFLTAFLALALMTSVGCRKNVDNSGMDSSADSSAADGTAGDSSTSGDSYGDGSDSATGAGGAGSSLSPVYFGFDQATLSTSARQTLRGNYETMRAMSGSKFIIEGHCDSRGTEEYNLALGEQRARAIRDYLVNLGASSTKLSIISYGEERPASSGDSESSWSQNRRGEFVLINE